MAGALLGRLNVRVGWAGETHPASCRSAAAPGGLTTGLSRMQGPLQLLVPRSLHTGGLEVPRCPEVPVESPEHVALGRSPRLPDPPSGEECTGFVSSSVGVLETRLLLRKELPLLRRAEPGWGQEGGDSKGPPVQLRGPLRWPWVTLWASKPL